MKLYNLCVGILIFASGMCNASEKTTNPEVTTENKHLIESQIAEYEVLLKDVNESHSPAKESLKSFYSQYLQGLHNLHQRVDKKEKHINIPQELHNLYLKNNPEVAGYSY